MSPRLKRRVRQRAGGRCEYCQLPEHLDPLPFHIDHVIAKQHRGRSGFLNLALACAYCNERKGTNIASIDPATGRLVPLFNPRQERWSRHFRWAGARLVGLTAVGRATVLLFGINHAINLALRRSLIAEGLFK